MHSAFISPSGRKDIHVEENNCHDFQYLDETSDAWSPSQALQFYIIEAFIVSLWVTVFYKFVVAEPRKNMFSYEKFEKMKKSSIFQSIE